MTERVLIATWGNPFEWEEIVYDYDNLKMKSFCTLPILKEKINPNKTIIIVLDTLANIVNPKTGEPDIKQREFTNYKEVVDDVRDRVKYFVEEKIGENFKEITLIVAPGVGVFSNIEVYGDLLDYYYYITFQLAKELPNKNMEVYLDLTHGINFMPVLTYKAVLNLLGLAAFLKEVYLTVLNSEPYPKGVSKDKLRELKLNVKSVEIRKIHPTPITDLLSNFNQWNAFISSVANGFPLVFGTFYPKEKDVLDEINNKLRKFLESIKVCGRKIKRQSALDPDFRILSELSYFLRVLNTSSVFRQLPKREISLKELKEISNIFNNLPRIGIIVREQMRHLEERLTRSGKPMSHIDSSWRQLSSYIRLGDISSPFHTESIERVIRNFIAHSGFEYNITMVRKFLDSIQFKYRSKEKVVFYAIEAMKYKLGEGDEVQNQGV